jgi:hypothetical protein
MAQAGRRHAARLSLFSRPLADHYHTATDVPRGDDGYRQSAGRAALRTLLTHEEPPEKDEEVPVLRQRRRQRKEEPTLFPIAGSDLFAEGQGKPSADLASEPSSMDIASVAPRDVSGITRKRTSASRETLKGSRTRRRKKGQEDLQ